MLNRDASEINDRDHSLQNHFLLRVIQSRSIGITVEIQTKFDRSSNLYFLIRMNVLQNRLLTRSSFLEKVFFDDRGKASPVLWQAKCVLSLPSKTMERGFVYFSGPFMGRWMKKSRNQREPANSSNNNDERRTESEKRRDRNSVQPWRLTLIAATCYLFVFASSRTDHVCPTIHVPMVSACLKEILTRRFSRASPKNFQDFTMLLGHSRDKRI